MAVRVSLDYLKRLSDGINAVSDSGQRTLRARLSALADELGITSPEELLASSMDDIETIFEAVAQSSASLSATSYDMVRTVAVGEGLGAAPVTDRDGRWTRDALYAIASQRDDLDGFIKATCDRLDYEAKRAAGSTQFHNGARDPRRPRFARVPTGPETCPFCVMLASRGFDYYSEAAAGKLDHYHPHCDCRVVPRFGDETYEGYDPDAYYEDYERLIAEGRLDKDALASSSRRAKARKRAKAMRRKPSPRKYGFDEVVGDGDKIAGVPKGEPMGFFDADRRRANPHVREFDANRMGYTTNCQTCVVVNELRRRGWNLEAKNRGGDAERTMSRLARDSSIAWRTKDGKSPTINRIYKAPTIAEQRRLLEDAVEPGKRYTFSFCWKDEGAHIVCLDRDELGELRLYCPQSGYIYTGKILDNYLKKIQFARGVINARGRYTFNPEIMRVDDLLPLASVVNEISREATT